MNSTIADYFTGKEIFLRSRFELVKDRIQVISGSDFQPYDAMEYSETRANNSLISMFSGIDTDSPESILEFCKTFGLLNQKVYWAGSRRQVHSPNRCNLHEFVHQVALFQRLVHVITRLNQRDVEFSQLIELVLEPLFPGSAGQPESETRMNWEREFGSGKIDPNDWAARLVMLTINDKLADVRPLIIWDQAKGAFIEHSDCPSLLSFVYLQLMRSLTHGAILMKCQNDNCRRYFTRPGSNTTKQYHSPECGLAQRQRKYNHRKKDRNSTVGGTVV